MKKTIKNKLLISYISIAAITLFIIVTVLVGFVYIKKTNVTIGLADKLSKIMGTNLAASLSFDDKRSAKNILESLYIDDTIEGAFVYDENGKLFAQYIRNKAKKNLQNKLKLLQNNATYHDVDNIIVSSNIVLDNENIGKLILLYNTNDVTNTLEQIVLILLFISGVILIIMFKVSSLLQQRLTAPIYVLVDTMKDILKQNNYTKIITQKSDDEFQTVFDGFNTMLNTIQKNKSELENLANTDSLTGLYNRRHFYELINPLLSILKRENKVSAILMLDIDKFKNINDTYGHDVGDKILKDVTRVTSKNIRESDIFARFGGEEFIVFLPNTNHKSAILVAQKVRKSIENIRSVQDIKSTVSIGISEILDDVGVAIKEADIALYRAKENGRNRVEFYN